jgi:hypothetical protein
LSAPLPIVETQRKEEPVEIAFTASQLTILWLVVLLSKELNRHRY